MKINCKYCQREFTQYSCSDKFCCPECKKRFYVANLNANGGLHKPRKINMRFNKFQKKDEFNLWPQKKYA